MNCRHCNKELEHVFLDLGFAPPSNAYLNPDDLDKGELYFPLKLYVCDECWLVQTKDYATPDQLFTNEYAYFSSVSKGWLNHALGYTDMICNRLNLGKDSFVIEVASNDGYLLKNFVDREIPCLGIEPTDSTADAAEKLNIPVLREFFGTALAENLALEGKKADLIAGNNVYAHVPDINDFTKGLKIALKPGGTVTLEFPHLMQLIQNTQFDTVYHEHYSYLSIYSVSRIFEKAGLMLFDVEELPTHGGSLRVYGCHTGDERKTTKNVITLLEAEKNCGMRDLSLYQGFQKRADVIKNNLISFLINQKKLDRKVGAYGAAAKGNTLLNYAGIRPDLLPFVCDSALSKQGKFLPGSHIPILDPGTLREKKTELVIILPWNIADEVVSQHSYIREWGGRFIVAIPKLRDLL